MILAMASLVALQWYWIKNAFQVQQEQFDRNVKTALSETVRKVEQEEVLYIAQQRLAGAEERKLLEITDEMRDRKKILEQDLAMQSFYNDMLFRDLDKKFENQRERVPENRLKASEFINEKLKVENENLKNFIKSNETLETRYQDMKQMTQWLDSNRTYQERTYISGQMNLELLKGIVQDLVLGEREIANRMGTLMLDTLLQDELANLGIPIPFQYAVEDRGKVVLTSVHAPILTESYRIRLFPGDAFPSQQYLYVSFPDRENHIYKNLMGLVGISTLLLVLVGSIFYYSANSLISERKLAKVKNDFINNMTHELKTPVSSISLALEVIRDSEVPKTEEKKARYLGIIQEENQRLASQIDRVLQLAKLEQKQIKLNLEIIDVHESLSSILSNLEVRLHTKGIKCARHFEATDKLIQADTVHFTNIIYNLLDNAIKYSGENVNLRVATENLSNKKIAISISDQGIGIGSADQKRIFEKFYRVTQGDVHDVKGFGIGLSYVKSLVELHGAEIEVHSELGKGSTFSLIFPIIA